MNIDHVYANRLLDHYGSLLTDRQRQVLEDYYQNDFSMQEIATNEGISKAAVSDLLNRVRKQLLKYEKILHLLEKEDKRKEVYAKMRQSTTTHIQEFLEILEKIEKE